MLVVGPALGLWLERWDPRQTKCSHCTRSLFSVPRGVGDEVQRQYEFSFDKIELKSLILAQIERWRHALHMQVERQRGGNPGGERRTGEEYIGTYPRVGDNAAKAALIPHIL